MDIKLNNYLKKWIVITIFYQADWIFNILGYVLPAMPLVKLLLGLWILAPQFKGEFFIYHFLIEYLLQFEHYILNIRCQFSSNIVYYSQLVSFFVLRKTITFLSEECIVKTQDFLKSAQNLLE